MSAELLGFAEAQAKVAAYASAVVRARGPLERVRLENARGRVLAEAVRADADQPAFARSTRDGFACRAKEASTHAWLQIAGTTHAGEAPPGPLPLGMAWEIMTGAPAPGEADAVVMIEHVERKGEKVRLTPSRKIKAGENIVAQGAQAGRGAELVAAGTRIGAAQIAVAAACGTSELEVFTQPRVAILTTGDELVAIDREPAPGQIRNSNAPMLAALVSATGGFALVLPPAADTPEDLDGALRQAMGADLLLISGGVSAGKFDLVEPALARLGGAFHFTGVRMQPGKPLVFGEVPRTAKARAAGSPLPFFGLPGNPISSAATFLLFASQVVAALAGAQETRPQFLAAQLTAPTDSKAKPGLTRFLPAQCDFGVREKEMPQVAVVAWHGSGDLPAFARANCFVMVPEEAGTLDAGTTVRIVMI